MSKHTPGHWKVQPIPNDACCHECAVETLEGDHIADIANQNNAKLIASAPELLEACKWALEYLQPDWEGDDKKGGMAIRKLEQAIQKAEGV